MRFSRHGMRRIHRSKGKGIIPGVGPETDLISTTVSLVPDSITGDNMIGEPGSSADQWVLSIQDDTLQFATGAGVTDCADRANCKIENR